MIVVSPEKDFQNALKAYRNAPPESHKGQNGKLLIIGGSAVFHAASIWAAAAASRITDMVHYSSTVENSKIFTNLKSKFLDGIVIKQADIPFYASEDDCILIGPGMERGKVSSNVINDRNLLNDFNQITQLDNEADYTYALIYHLIHHYPEKKFVLDAAALQMMKPEWLLKLKQTPIVTPHSREFEALFGQDISNSPIELKREVLTTTASKFHTFILYKQISDILADHRTATVISGGNTGLTKGGTGDVLAGLAAAFYCKQDARTSCIFASMLVKRSAEILSKSVKTMYNTSDLIQTLPIAYSSLFDN